MTGRSWALLFWGLLSLPVEATPPLVSMSGRSGVRPIEFQVPQAAISGKRIVQSTVGECGSCGTLPPGEPFRPRFHRLIEFLCYRPQGSCFAGLEPSEYVPPLWAWFTSGVCHARQGCDAGVASCGCAPGCAPLDGADGPIPTLVGAIRPQPMVFGGNPRPLAPLGLRTFAMEPRKHFASTEPTPLTTYQKSSPSDRNVVPSGFYIPSSKTMPLLRHYQRSDSGDSSVPNRSIPTILPRR